jgi:hypothetical protein
MNEKRTTEQPQKVAAPIIKRISQEVVSRRLTPDTKTVVRRPPFFRSLAKSATPATPNTSAGPAPRPDIDRSSAGKAATAEPNDRLRTGKLIDVPLNELQISDKRRPADPEKVRVLAASMAVIGLQMPITVMRNEAGAGANFALVAGLHRYQAARSLSWASIPAVLIDHNEYVARRWQLEENLIRADLDVLDRAAHIAGWVKLSPMAAISGQVDHKTAGRPESGIALAARSLPIEGKTDEARRQVVKRAIKIDGIAEEAKRFVRILGLANNQSALFAIANEATPPAQVAKAQELAGSPRKPSLKRASTPASSDSDGALNEPGPAAAVNPSLETGIVTEAEEIVGRFRAAWEACEARAIWNNAPPEIRARIVAGVLQYWPVP